MIALLRGTPLWRILLNQEGVPVCEPGSADTRTLVLDCEPSGHELKLLDRHIASGRAVLAGPDSVAALLGHGKTRRVYARYIAPDSSPFFDGIGLIDLDEWISPTTNASAGMSDCDTRVVHSGSIGKAPVVILPFELGRLLSVCKTAVRRFRVESRHQPSEFVSAIPRGEVRRLIANCLRYLHAKIGAPYVRLSPFPPGLQGLAAMRIDTDAATPADFRLTAKVASALGDRLSWFINASSPDLDRSLLGQLASDGHELQLHCYRHRVWPDYRRSLADIAAGLKRLSELGVSASGYAAPYGEWNARLQRAIADSGLLFSSEFAWSYDDLPSRPLLAGTASGSLQVPVHPVCSGSLRRARIEDVNVRSYFASLSVHRWSRREPCFLYEHPVRDAYEADRFSATLSTLRSTCGLLTTMGDYARWWCTRESVKYSIRCASNRFQVGVQRCNGDFDLLVEFDGRESWVRLSGGEIPYSDMSWLNLPRIPPAPRPGPEVRRGDRIAALRSLRQSLTRGLQKRRDRL